MEICDRRYSFYPSTADYVSKEHGTKFIKCKQ